MGLRAAQIVEVTFEEVVVPASQCLPLFKPSNRAFVVLYSYWFAGLSSIANGIARGALDEAWRYAGQRYQGGSLIVEHPAVRALLTDSEVRVAVVNDMIAQFARECSNELDFLRGALKLKLFGISQSAQVVTDSLQVFGGYGYMEDYRMEKRLRDVQTLKSLGGGTYIFRNLIFDLLREERDL